MTGSNPIIQFTDFPCNSVVKTFQAELYWKLDKPVILSPKFFRAIETYGIYYMNLELEAYFDENSFSIYRTCKYIYLKRSNQSIFFNFA